ncbi:hypothetical protein D918_06096 [Trichuris suis]|nr:hypothetical protein D918_06096 [Trichuris suis]
MFYKISPCLLSAKGQQLGWRLSGLQRVPCATYTFSQLHPGVTYAVRVNAVRLCPTNEQQKSDGFLEVPGPSSTAVFTTLASPVRNRTSEVTSATTLPSEGTQLTKGSYRGLTDNQFAWVILAGFTLVAAVIAFIIEKVIAGN